MRMFLFHRWVKLLSSRRLPETINGTFGISSVCFALLDTLLYFFHLIMCYPKPAFPQLLSMEKPTEFISFFRATRGDSGQRTEVTPVVPIAAKCFPLYFKIYF